MNDPVKPDADPSQAPAEVDPRQSVADAAKELARVCREGAESVRRMANEVIDEAMELSRVARKSKSQQLRAVRPGEKPPPESSAFADGLTARFDTFRPG